MDFNEFLDIYMSVSEGTRTEIKEIVSILLMPDGAPAEACLYPYKSLLHPLQSQCDSL